MKIENQKLGFIGFGHMAQVICRGLQKARLIPRSQILFHRRDPAKAKRNEQEFGLTATSMAHLVEHSDLLLVCVRPNQVEGVLKEIASYPNNEKMFISVAVGVPISFIQKQLSQKAQVARAMPNVASEVGEGMSLISFAKGASMEFQSMAEVLFGAFGRVMKIPEAFMDIGSALAGSGPAFVLELIEAMAREGVKEGFTYAQALEIAAQAFFGAAKLVLQGSLPEDLLHSIATPGGTTQEGLDAMRRERVAIHFSEAIASAAQRSLQISDQFPS